MFVFITDQNPLSRVRAHLFDVDFELVQKSSQNFTRAGYVQTT